MLFDEPELYYETDDGRYWQQGDIVLAPVAVFDQDLSTVQELGPAPFPGTSTRRLIWTEADELSVPDLVADAQLCPAILTTHDCAMDKDFLRQYRALRKTGMQKREAVREAAADQTLDPYLNIAPLIPLEAAAPSAPAELSANKVIGFFPICESADRGIDPGVADLLRETTIDKTLIVDRLGILTSEAVAAMRYALARFWVYRAPKLTFEIERVVGKKIVDVRLSSEGTLALELQLSDGETIRFLQEPTVGAQGAERPGLP